MVVPGVLGADGKRVFPRIDLDFDFSEIVLAARALDRINLHFVAIPGFDLHWAIDVCEINAAVRRQGIGLVEFLGLRKSPRLQGKSQECGEGTKQSASPGRASGELCHTASFRGGCGLDETSGVW
jgi:hypothetical protein